MFVSLTAFRMCPFFTHLTRLAQTLLWWMKYTETFNRLSSDRRAVIFWSPVLLKLPLSWAERKWHCKGNVDKQNCSVVSRLFQLSKYVYMYVLPDILIEGELSFIIVMIGIPACQWKDSRETWWYWARTIQTLWKDWQKCKSSYTCKSREHTSLGCRCELSCDFSRWVN